MWQRSILGATVLAASVVSCGPGGGGGEHTEPPKPLNVLTAIYPATSYIVVQGTTTLHVSGVFGGPSLPPMAWESGNAAIATVDSDGTVAALSPGETTITAYLESDPSAQVTSTVVVVPLAEETPILAVGPKLYSHGWGGGNRVELFPDDINGCRGIAAAPGGKVYVLAGWTIWSLDLLEGRAWPLKTFPTGAEDPATGFGNMGSLAIDSAGRLYTVGFTSRSPGDVILRVDPSDGSVTQFAEVPYTLSLVAGLEVDSNDNVYALGTLVPGSLVTRFSPNGAATNVLPNYNGDDMGTGMSVVGNGTVIYVAFQHNTPGAFSNYGIYRCTNTNADPVYEDVTPCADGFGNIAGIFWAKDGLLVNGSSAPSTQPQQIFRLKDTSGDGFYSPAERSVWSSQAVDGNSSMSVFARLNPW